MENSLISLVKETDILELQKIGKQTFLESFSSDDSTSDMEHYLAEKFSVEQLKKELKNSESFFFFLQIENKIVGYLKVNTGKAQTENCCARALEIERIYILSNYQGKKMGQLLFDKAIEVAKKKRIKHVWLGVWENNDRAIHFYKKNGLVEFDKHKFKFGEDEPINLMMELKLS